MLQVMGWHEKKSKHGCGSHGIMQTKELGKIQGDNCKCYSLTLCNQQMASSTCVVATQVVNWLVKSNSSIWAVTFTKKGTLTHSKGCVICVMTLNNESMKEAFSRLKDEATFCWKLKGMKEVILWAVNCLQDERETSPNYAGPATSLWLQGS